MLPYCCMIITLNSLHLMITNTYSSCSSLVTSHSRACQSLNRQSFTRWDTPLLHHRHYPRRPTFSHSSLSCSPPLFLIASYPARFRSSSTLSSPAPATSTWLCPGIFGSRLSLDISACSQHVWGSSQVSPSSLHGHSTTSHLKGVRGLEWPF